ncbi:MAG: hypothetical protein CM15mV25_0190 [uncultured marine virus]|nr:MAG: hypothetical protein CM15mV25_0190 [uncultured marine virus]
MFDVVDELEKKPLTAEPLAYSNPLDLASTNCSYART